MTIRQLPRAPLAATPAAVRSDILPGAMDRWHTGIRAAAGNDENTISIFDPIGADWFGEGVTAKRVAGALRAIKGDEITVQINSPGGDVFEGLAIYNLLAEDERRVTVKVLGLAASAASFIAMAGDDVQVARSGFLMIHNAWVMALGNRHDLRDAADTLEPFDAALSDIYATRTGLSADEIAAMMDKETWMNGSDAVAKGFADGLLASDAVKEEKGGRASALSRIDRLLAKAEVPRTERRALIKELTATPSAGGQGTPSAADAVDDDGTTAVSLALARLKLTRA
ncbi:ATP-dependent Clp protease protease subunit [Methylobacterium sp. PvP062]|uniref:ATP-dependent Clp protease proteolytic subunit n=1 Tax=Methylobacterium radiotolerans TaxID=31998 RepID=A0ABV2NN08_9HYPH|nr:MULTISPECIES: head maturation protease, ClpP-related [unclassified Methylobacterium]MBP2495390.1 ATP-dependent protease ClpP protease subunit [Methylobacterium sp. PvP105]MBP2504739.1 ATP-dependent protease ClpP protease subunit [Methylobacterium sp. PvP109]MCX7335749.1 Clp protease ClpP [Hyphomicrobiales bacterium]